MQKENCICLLEEGEEKLINKGSWVDLYINLDRKEYWIEAIADGKAAIQIDFCPICGRKLVEDEEENDLWEW